MYFGLATLDLQQFHEFREEPVEPEVGSGVSRKGIQQQIRMVNQSCVVNCHLKTRILR